MTFPVDYVATEPVFCSLCGDAMMANDHAGFNRISGQKLRKLICTTLNRAATITPKKSRTVAGWSHAVSKPKGRYYVEYRVSVFAVVDMGPDMDDEDRIARVVIDDENTGKPVTVETDDGARYIEEGSDEWMDVVKFVDGPNAVWPAWEHGW